MTHYDINDLYNYHAPNERTTPLYAAARSAEAANLRLVDHIETCLSLDDNEGVRAEQTSPTYYGQINEAARKTAAQIPDPDSAASHLVAAAHVAVSLFRNAMNEAVATRRGVPSLMAVARTKAQEIRWLTSGAIAVGDASMTNRDKP